MSDKHHEENEENKEEELFFDLDAGTREFYEDPYYYDYEFKDRKEDVRFYRVQYQEVEGWALEIGVGTARIAAPAVRAGAKIIGLDLHKGMLKVAQERRQRLPKARRADLKLIQGDMRDFKFKERFSLITCPFNVLQHMYTNEDVGRCLKQVRTHLEEGGVFLFDVLMPDFDYLSRSPFKRFPGVDFKHPTWKVTYNYSEQSAYDPVRQLNHIWLHYDRVDPYDQVNPPSGDAKEEPPLSHCIQLSHRYFFPLELEGLLDRYGFEVLSRFGDFNGGPLCEGAESMVYFCQLKDH